MKILLVEDNPVDTRLIQDILSENATVEFELVQVARLGDALNRLRATVVDVILLDLVLPDSQGLDTLMQLHNQVPLTPIVVLTSLNDQTLAIQALQVGAQDYLIKGQMRGSDALMRSMRYAIERKRNEAIWCQQEQAFRTLTDRAPDIIARFDQNLRHLYVNPAVEQATGLPVQAFLGKTNRDMGMPEAQVEQWEHALRQVLTTGLPASIEFEFLTPDGVKSYQSRCVPEFAIDGSVESVLGITRDITEQKQAQARLKDILDSASAAIYSFRVFNTGAWEYEYWSAQCEVIFGYTPQEFMADKTLWRSRVLPEDLTNLMRRTTENSFLPTGTVEYRFHHKDGSLRWISCTFTARHDQPTESWVVTAVATDISERVRLEAERKLAEAALRESEARFSEAFTYAAIGMALCALDGSFLKVNQALCEITGYSEPELLSMNFQTITHPDDLEIDLGYTQQLLAGEIRFYHLEKRYFHKLSHSVWILLSVALVQDEQGQPLYFIAQIQDISDRKQLETEQQQAELALQQRLLREQLIADISQDIRQSLDLNAVLSRTVERVREVLKTDRVFIYRFHADWSGTIVVESVNTDYPSALQANVEDQYFMETRGEDYRQGRIQAVANIQTADLTPCHLEMLTQFHIQANLVVPILQGERLWGLLVANQCSAPRYWQPEEIDLLRQLATQAGIAIQQSELYEQTRHELCERQRMQTILAESEARFRNMADHAPVMIWVSDPTGSCSFLSQSWYEFTGQTEETGLGEGWLDAVHPDDRELVKTRFLTTNARQEAFQLDYRLRRHDGEYRWAVDTASPRIGADGQFQGYIGSVLDISDRKRAEAALRESQQRYMSLTEASPVGILCFDATGQCAYVNDRWSEMTGRPVEAARGSGWLRAIHPDDRDQTLLRWNQWLQAGEPVLAYRGEGRILRPDGRMVWFYCQILPEISSNGSLVGYIGSLTDISNRKQAELALQQQLQREQLITDISQDIRRSLSLNNVLSRTVERVRQVLNTDRVIIFRFRPNGQGKVISESVGATWIPILSTIIADPCFNDRCIEPFRQGHIATISDLDTAAIAPCHAELLQQFQVRANVVVPILQGETLWGFLIVHHCDAPRHWQPSEIDLLRQLATQVGIAIQQSELYEQTRHELRKRQQMQAVLEASEERFRTLSAAAPIGICQTNADGICLYTNARWQQLSGFSFTDCLGNGWLRAIHPDDRPALLTAWDAYAQGTSNYLPEFRLITPQGQIRWVSAQVAVMKSATDEIMGYVSTYEDITERKLAEQTIKEQAALLDIASDAIFVRDLNHRILYWNQGAEQLYGWTAAAAIGQLAPELLRNDPAQISGMMQTLLDAGDWRGELRKVTQAGKEVIVEARWTLVRDATGQPKSILSVDTDITQQKQLEAQFLRTQRLESLGTLASGIAHDMNNILTPVLAAAQLVPLKLPDLDEQSQRLLKILEDNAKRGALLVKQILTFARGLEGERLPVQVERILAELEPMLKSTFPKSITISVNVPTSKLWPVSADATQLHQVFMNLCVNARDAMPDGGTLQLSADNFVVDPSFAQLHLQAQVGAYVVITISDTGTGIPSDIQERIFDPFFTTKAVGKGTGLGLSTVLGIVKSHGGFVEVQSQPGVGSQFQIYLPAIAAVSPSTVSESDLPLGQGELILVVDDEENILQTAQTILETHNYRVLTARDGIDAIAGYAEHWRDIRLVIIDMMMPEMDGLSAVRALQHINPQVEVLAMSGLAGDYRQSAQALGIHTFLTKPFTTQELLQMIHTQLDND